MNSILRTAAMWLLVMLVGLGASAQDSAEPDSVVIAPSANDSAQERNVPTSSSIQLETTSVTGSRELPKVLVIVPWKTSEALGPGERPLASLVEEVLAPIDPDEFRREIDYYTELADSSPERGATPSPDHANDEAVDPQR